MDELNKNNEIPKVKQSLYSVIVKRFFDIVFSAIAIVLFSWLLIIIVILELFFHGTPVVYKQKRLGKNGVIFNIYKFRSMTEERDKNGKLLPGELRITKFGRFIRRYSLDELPELFCILIGKMSIIGPRPLLPEYCQFYSERHKMRHSVRPGLACVPIVPISSWTWNDQFENDIYYIENISFGMDVMMIMAVLKEVVNGSYYRVNDTREPYNGNNLYSDVKKQKEKYENFSDSSSS